MRCPRSSSRATAPAARAPGRCRRRDARRHEETEHDEGSHGAHVSTPCAAAMPRWARIRYPLHRQRNRDTVVLITSHPPSMRQNSLDPGSSSGIRQAAWRGADVWTSWPGTKVEEERDGVVSLLHTIADRLHALTPFEVRRSLARLASPLALLAHEAEPVIGPLPAIAHSDVPIPIHRPDHGRLRAPRRLRSALDARRVLRGTWRAWRPSTSCPPSRSVRPSRSRWRRACRSLPARVLGIRVDRAWQSFHQFADELARLARAELGVRDVVLFDPESRIGRPRRRAARSSTSRARSTPRSSASALEGRARRGVSTTRSSVSGRQSRRWSS